MKEILIDGLKFKYEDENRAFNYVDVNPPITRNIDRKFEDDLYHFYPDERRNSGFINFYIEARSLEEFFDLIMYFINRGWKSNFHMVNILWQKTKYIKKVNFTINKLNSSLNEFMDPRGELSFSIRVDRKDIDKFRKDLKNSGYITCWAKEDFINTCL